MPTIYQTLKTDHDKHRYLLAELAETQGDSEDRRKLWQTFYYDVSAHAAAEELSFYSKLISESEGQPEGRHSVAEHHELEEMIQGLHEMDFSSPGWLARFRSLQGALRASHQGGRERDFRQSERGDRHRFERRDRAQTFTSLKKNERGKVDEKAEQALED